MFVQTPREREFLSWAFVALWSGLIFVTVPFVRAGTDYVRSRWGGEAFTYGVTVIVILVAGISVALLLKRRQTSGVGYAWLLGVAGLIIYLTFGLGEGSPEEAVHYLQYGILSLLLYRAFTHRVRDYSIYAAAAITGTVVGMVDETIQWLTPRRYFGLRDIWLNFIAVALIQIAVAKGVRPKIISGWPGGASLRRICRLGAVAIAFLGLCMLNTADRIAWYTARVPWLGFIDVNHSVMVEYGYLLGDPATGQFRSRLTADELRRESRDRAETAAAILKRYRDHAQYDEFLSLYTPVTDPFLHEAKVHIYSRDINLARARENNQAQTRTRQFTNAYRENRILEDYFGKLIHAAGHAWPAALEAEVQENIDPDMVSESRVSEHLITAYSPRQAFWFFLTAVIGLLLLESWFGRRTLG